jgi:hypothetical protein
MTPETEFFAHAHSITKPRPTLRQIVHHGPISGESTIRVALQRIANIGGVDMVLVHALEGRPFDINQAQTSNLPDADMRPDTHAQFVYWSDMRWVSPLALLADRPECEPDAIAISIPLNVNTFERNHTQWQIKKANTQQML